MRIKRLNLKKLNNTRDLGGFPTANGRRVKSGKLLRSGRLYKLPASTVNALKAMGLKVVVDLRTDKERENYPQTVIEGVKYVHLPLMCTATTGITHEKSMAGTMLEESKRIKSEFGTADNYMVEMYKIILFDENSSARIRKFFDLVLETADEGCILWHCNAGKDRTGILAMLLLALLGVDEELILRDYVISNKFRRKTRFTQRIGIALVPVPIRFKLILRALMDARPQFLRGAIAHIKERCGSVEGYCKEILQLTDEQISTIREKYTV